MSTVTPNQGLILPTDPDLGDVPTALNFYNSRLETRLVQRYINSVDRSVRNPGPEEGSLSYLEDINAYEWFDGTNWVTLFSSGAWTPYVPTWGTVSGTPSTIGNGTLSGRYQQIGKTVNFYVQITMGSTTTYAVNQWTISLPVPALTSVTLRQLVAGRVFDSSPSNAFLAVAHISNAAFMSLDTQSSTTPGTDALRQGFPITFAVNDSVQFGGTYEAA